MKKIVDKKIADVIPIRPEKFSQASEKKWGKAVMKLGFSIIPSLLLRAQRRLGLNPTQLAVLLQIADYWWDENRKPYPSKESLSERLGIGPRQVQRYISELEDAQLIKRIQRYAKHGGKLSNEYDLSGLVKKLAELEPEFRKVQEETKAMRKQVEKPGGLKRNKKKSL